MSAGRGENLGKDHSQVVLLSRIAPESNFFFLISSCFFVSCWQISVPGRTLWEKMNYSDKIRDGYVPTYVCLLRIEGTTVLAHNITVHWKHLQREKAKIEKKYYKGSPPVILIWFNLLIEKNAGAIYSACTCYCVLAILQEKNSLFEPYECYQR